MQIEDDLSIKAGALITSHNSRSCEVLVLHQNILQSRLLYLLVKQHSYGINKTNKFRKTWNNAGVKLGLWGEFYYFKYDFELETKAITVKPCGSEYLWGWHSMQEQY